MTLQEVIAILETMPKAERGFDFSEFAQKHNWKCASGATKFCYIIPDCDFVIKFCSNNRRHNECEQEAKAYQSAKTFKVERVLLETRFVYENPNGTRFFTQPKINETSCQMSRSTLKKCQKVTKTVTREMVHRVQRCMYYSDVDRTWLATMISLYGKRFARSFELWTKENRVNDLHNANLGYINGKPVLLDYSGYCNF